MIVSHAHYRIAAIVWAWAAWMSMGSICRAQESRATMVGQVRDPTSAVIPNAKVRITHVATSVTVTVPTNEQGNYVAPYLIPGVYTVVCDASGFKQFRREGVELRVNDRVEINIFLQIGDATETVLVTGESTMLETATASTGQVVDGRRISELPMP